MRMAVLSILTATVAFGVVPAAAQTAPTSASSDVSPRERPLETTSSDERRAREWGLKPEEWSRYRELMEGPLGVFSPNLDPLTALGIQARSAQERARYAELQVRVEAERVEKTLAYQRAYDAAWQRIFPDQPRITVPGGSSASPGNAGSGRLAVFVKAGCPPCDRRVRQLQSAGAEFDLYMVGSRQDDDRIRNWARQSGIDPAKVRARAITLNHDGGRWLSLGLSGDLPAVVQEVEGQWQRR